ncbi:hypothetical protein [Escherichia coli]|uniref:hypothetical protein n=1 Tax=Escherichia coli TaxID=562 RepID=UPI000A3A7437|nr:hypothetical protein [Escherichia coli]
MFWFGGIFAVLFLDLAALVVWLRLLVVCVRFVTSLNRSLLLSVRLGYILSVLVLRVFVLLIIGSYSVTFAFLFWLVHGSCCVFTLVGVMLHCLCAFVAGVGGLAVLFLVVVWVCLFDDYGCFRAAF